MNGEQNPIVGEKSSSGLTIAAVVILIIVVLAGLYFWIERSDNQTEEAMEAIETQSTSDDAASIEADLEATDVENLDMEFNAS